MAAVTSYRRITGIAAAIRVLIVASLAAGFIGARGSGQAATTNAGAAIGTGLIHTCALNSNGGVECWGFNAHNELGEGGVRYRTIPGDVSGLTGNVTAIAIGSRHGCALLGAGDLKCWGYNRYGQLGDGTTTNSSVPVAVSGLRSAARAVVASFHTCALESGGVVQCWGSNAFGELGDGTKEDRANPVAVAGLGAGVTAIAAGDSHSCALMSPGGVKCWGDNSSGQLGDGTTDDQLTPVDVFGLGPGIKAIAAGGLHSCALTDGGGVECWGANAAGQLGDGTTRSRSRPVSVSGLSRGVTAIAAGLRHTCALTTAGAVKCWGLNDSGQVGDGRIGIRSKPIDVFGLGHGVTAIAAGGLHSCALTRAGSVRCWGRNVEGELGDGTEVDRLRPVGVIGFGPASATMTIVSRSVRVTSAHVAAIRLRCGEAAPCRGAITLSAVHGRRVGATRVTLATRRFSIARGRIVDLESPLTSYGFRLLDRANRLRTRVWVNYAQPDETTAAAIREITLIAPKG